MDTSNSTTKVKPFYNRSLERALQVLSIFSNERQSLTLAQLAQIANLAKSTVMRLCYTLIQYNFHRYDRQTKEYVLGPKIMDLGNVATSAFSLRGIVAPHLAELQMRVGMTTFLAVMQDDYLLCLEKKDDARNPITYASLVGKPQPPYFGMLGQVLMAFVPETEVMRLLEKTPLTALTENSITDQPLFLKRLKMIRENAFFIDEGEAVDGIGGAAAPIRDYTGKVVGAIGAAFILSFEDDKSRNLVQQEVCKVAKEISGELGYIGQLKTPSVLANRSGSPGESVNLTQKEKNHALRKTIHPNYHARRHLPQ